MIPPPIVNSVYTSRPVSSSALSPPWQENLSWLHRKQRQLENDLQLLLDAQGEGLVAGLEGTTLEDDAASTGSSTPTMQSLNLGSRGRVPSRPQKKLSLRQARRGLYTSIRKLALLKADESRQLEPDVDECRSTVTQIEVWERKRGVMRERMQKIEEGVEYKKVERLRHEADGMQTEINETEARLADLKRTQKRLWKEAEDVESTIQSKLSSYTTNLRVLEAEIRQFVKESRSVGLSSDKSKSLTLDSIKDSWTKERDALTKKQEVVETEREALEEGAVVWKDVVKEVSDFEKALREEMASLLQPLNAEGRGGSKGKDTAESSMHTLLSRMEQTTIQLESKHKLAEARNWKLLICAIGAELEAFRKGREVLEAALASTEEETVPGYFEGANEEDETGVSSIVRTKTGSSEYVSDRGEAIRDLDSAFQDKRHANGISDTDTEDDGPDPELMISHHDTDTE